MHRSDWLLKPLVHTYHFPVFPYVAIGSAICVIRHNNRERKEKTTGTSAADPKGDTHTVSHARAD